MTPPDSSSSAVGANTHGLERTSPKGGPFLGRCVYCGAENLPSKAALEPCPKAPTQDQQVLDAVGASLPVQKDDSAGQLRMLEGPAFELNRLHAHLHALKLEMEQEIRYARDGFLVFPYVRLQKAREWAAHLGRILAPAGETKE